MTLMVEIEALDAPLGARLTPTIDNLAFDENSFDVIRRALWQYRVLVISGGPYSDSVLISFAEKFGQLVTLYDHGTTVPGYPGIVRVSNIEKQGVPIGLAGSQAIPWHHDHSYLPCPAKDSFLQAEELPVNQPQTHFVDMAAVLQSLPESTVKQISQLQAAHHIDERDTNNKSEVSADVTPQYEDLTNVLAQQRIASQSAIHPLVVRHPDSCLAALYVSPLATHDIIGKSRQQSKQILEPLFERAFRPEYIYSHTWSQGDLVVWDTISTLHRRDAFSASSRRSMKQMSTQCRQPLLAAY